MPPKPKYLEGEKVFCYHGTLLYEAKVQRIIVKDNKQVKYYIHYAGWNRSWDEWVTEDRVLKLNDANRQKQIELAASNPAALVPRKGASSFGSIPKKALSSGNTTKVASSTGNISKGASITSSTSKGASITGSNGSRKSKRNCLKQANQDESITEFPKFQIPKVNLCEELKQWLVEDWNLVTQQNKLLQIPAQKTIKQIITSYVNLVKSTHSTNVKRYKSLVDITHSLISYFNAMLRSQLLYRSEKLQYDNILKTNPDFNAADLYGSFHLLRLLTRIDIILGYVPLEEEYILLFIHHVHGIQKYLIENINVFFSMEHFIDGNANK